MSPFANNEYTVEWIYALTLEMAMLDENLDLPRLLLYTNRKFTVKVAALIVQTVVEMMS